MAKTGQESKMAHPEAPSKPHFPQEGEGAPVSVIQLAHSNARVPDKFVKSASERPTVAYNDYCKEIPVISLKGLDSTTERDQAIGDIGVACEKWGIFQVVDHGVPAELMTRMRDIAEAFFTLPHEEKVKHASKPGGFPNGYGSGSHRSDDEVMDWRELISHLCLPLSVREAQMSTMWPETPRGYRETLVEYSDALDNLVKTLLGLISESLGLPTDYIKNAAGGEETEQKILLNYYPQCSQPDLTLGARSHTDYGTITILQQDVGGLQAYKEDKDKWVTVEPIRGALVVNLGDQIQILSNAKYCSVEHQAVVNADAPRLSIVVFTNPIPSAQLGPAPEFVTESNPAKYRTFTFRDYVLLSYDAKTKKTYDALAL